MKIFIKNNKKYFFNKKNNNKKFVNKNYIL